MEWLASALAALSGSIIVIGAAYGISHIGGKAMEAISRQPEAANDIRTNMILAAALIEGLGFFAAVICLLVAIK
jgi:F-type H+-transporting ATPase subunit c